MKARAVKYPAQTSRALLFGAALLAALPAAAEPAGVIKTRQGTVIVERGGQKLPASVGMTVGERDRILTAADGTVGLTLRDNTLLSAGPNSVIELNRFAFDTTTHAGALDASLRKGSLSVVSGKLAKTNPDAVSFSTPNLTLGVRGTEFVIEAGQVGE